MKLIPLIRGALGMLTIFLNLVLAISAIRADASAVLPAPITLSSGWLMQDVAQVKEPRESISKPGFAPRCTDRCRTFPRPLCNRIRPARIFPPH